MFGVRRPRVGLLAQIRNDPVVTLDDKGFTRIWGDGSTPVRCEWIDCGPFVAQSSGGRVPEVDIVWTCKGEPDWMSSRVVDAREVGNLIATMNRYRDAAVSGVC